MRLIARCQLHGDYGDVPPGHQFECQDDIAAQLIAQGMARKAEPPKILYETKIIRPPEVGPAVPFRDVFDSNTKPEELAAAGDPVLPEPDVSKQRGADPGGWRRRSRSGAKR